MTHRLSSAHTRLFSRPALSAAALGAPALHFWWDRTCQQALSAKAVSQSLPKAFSKLFFFNFKRVFV